MRVRGFVLTVALVTALIPSRAVHADLNYRAEITGAEDSDLSSLLDPVPQLGRTLLYGVGLGARYYTAFGPLRLELAPLLHQTPRPLSDPGLYQPRSGILTQWPELAFKAWLLPAACNACGASCLA